MTDEESAGFEYWKPEAPPRLAPYVVIDAGEGDMLLPFLFAVTPDVTGVELKASLTTSKATKAGLVIKILGNGFGGSAKITVTSVRQVTAAAGELVGLAVSVPVLWEIRADPTNEDNTWPNVEVLDDGRRSTPVRTFTDRGLVKTDDTFETAHYDTRDGGAKPLEISEERTVEGGAEFSVGFTIEALGIEATLSAELETSSTLALSATLPTGYRYAVSWSQAPDGGVVALS